MNVFLKYLYLFSQRNNVRSRKKFYMCKLPVSTPSALYLLVNLVLALFGAFLLLLLKCTLKTHKPALPVAVLVLFQHSSKFGIDTELQGYQGWDHSGSCSCAPQRLTACDKPLLSFYFTVGAMYEFSIALLFLAPGEK